MLKGTCVILRIFVEPLPKQTVEIAVVEYVYCQIYVASVIQEHSNRRTSLCLHNFSNTEMVRGPNGTSDHDFCNAKVVHTQTTKKEGMGICGTKEVFRSGWWRVRGRRGEPAPPPERGTSPATPAAPSPGSCLSQHHLVYRGHFAKSTLKNVRMNMR